VQALLRLVRQGADGIPEYQDTEVSADILSIGSAADSSLQLLGSAVAASHAAIRRAGDGFSISARGASRFTLNGREVASAALAEGDFIGIGKHRLQRVAAPAGFDIAVEIQLDETAAPSEFERAFRTDLDQTWLSKRRTSWLLFLLVPLLAFAIPLFTAMSHRSNSQVRTPAPHWLPDDTSWSTGKLIPAHEQAAGQRCEACHRQFFTHVRDPDCRKCHENIEDHVAQTRLALTTLGPQQRCAECHREHDAPGNSLVVRANSVCTDCHADSHSRFGMLQVDAVSSLKQHPEFKASLLRPVKRQAGTGTLLDWQTVRSVVGKAQEQSNLKFSHTQHLDANKVLRQNDSRPLGCADCHVLAADGEHFTPVTMAAVCASCHELTFDEHAPQRQLPHGKPRDAMLMLEDYYARQAADPAASKEMVLRRRLPDRTSEMEQCTGAPFECGMRRAAQEILTQFTRRGCVSCHEVQDNHAADMRERFEVQPVRLQRDYFVDTHFSHRIHAIQKDLTGDAACLSCHKAKQSAQSADLLLPAARQCRECHADPGTAERVDLSCVNCHSYHPVSIIASQKVQEERGVSTP
jgi:predicted CXXCH cytochrome family protein